MTHTRMAICRCPACRQGKLAGILWDFLFIWDNFDADVVFYISITIGGRRN